MSSTQSVLRFITLLFIQYGLSISGLPAQVAFSEIPENLQLIPQNVQTNKGRARFIGVITQPFTQVRVDVLRNDVFFTSRTANVSLGSSPNFSLFVDLSAELVEYDFNVYGVSGGTDQLLASVERVVIGDVYIIQGQSNAESRRYQGNADEAESPFLRTYGTGKPDPTDPNVLNPSWGEGAVNASRQSNNNVGQWPSKFAKRLIDSLGIPIAIFNGAHGGKAIDFFPRNDANPADLETNYGRLLHRTDGAKVSDHVRAILWYQGESDAEAGRSIDYYKDQFSVLYQDWMDNYPNLENIYLVQIRFACNMDDFNEALNIQEAQRQLANNVLGTPMMTAKGAIQWTDDCHFPYESGYSEIGERMANLVLSDMYRQQAVPNTYAPQVATLALVSPTLLKLTTTHSLDTLIWQDGAELTFFEENTNQFATTGWTNGNDVFLQFAQPLSAGLIALSHLDVRGAGIDSPYVTNAKGIGLVSFKNFGLNFFVSGGALTELGDSIPNVTFSLTDTFGSQPPLNSVVANRFNFGVDDNFWVGITATKQNESNPLNGVTVADVLLMRQHVTGINLLSTAPRVLAADVNGDGWINSADILLVEYLSIGAVLGFPGPSSPTSTNRTWAFYQNQSFPNPQNPFSADTVLKIFVNGSDVNESFLGVKLGDVNNTWDSSQAQAKFDREVTFHLPTTYANPGETVVVPVMLSRAEDLAGYQYELSWDPKVIRLLEAQNQSLPHVFSYQDTAKGILRVLYADSEGKGKFFADNTFAYNLRFQAIGGFASESSITIDGGDQIPIEAFDGTLQPLGIQVQPGKITLGGVSTTRDLSMGGEFGLHIQPNPLTESSTVSFSLIEPGQMTLSIWDQLGRELYYRTEWQGVGFQERSLWPLMGSLGPGLYVVRLATSQGVQSISVLKR